jgi:hypothetical protein
LGHLPATTVPINIILLKNWANVLGKIMGKFLNWCHIFEVFSHTVLENHMQYEFKASRNPEIETVWKLIAKESKCYCKIFYDKQNEKIHALNAHKTELDFSHKFLQLQIKKI